jgi:hypothetical protein
MSPADLPRFEILAVLKDRCTGRFDLSQWVGENWIAGLYLGGNRFLWGRFGDVDAERRTCSFVPDQLAELSALRRHEPYAFMDGYWGERAELVLDEGRSWQRTVFEPSDMVRFPGPGGTSMGTRYSAEAPVGGQVVPGGWDHEHCRICWQKIGCGGERAGYFSSPDAWVCQECYISFVVPRSLAFARQTEPAATVDGGRDDG